MPRRDEALLHPRRLPASANQFVASKEIGDLDRRILRAVAAMGAVCLDALCEKLADGAIGRIGRVGGAHQVAVLRHGVLAFQHLHDDRAGHHEIHQILEEGAGRMHAVEFLRLGAAHLDALLADDAQSIFLKDRVDLAGEIPPRGVRLEDAESAFDGHESVLMMRLRRRCPKLGLPRKPRMG